MERKSEKKKKPPNKCRRPPEAGAITNESATHDARRVGRQRLVADGRERNVIASRGYAAPLLRARWAPASRWVAPR
eukprot:3869822-Pyramimonas_sp.AAC.1